MYFEATPSQNEWLFGGHLLVFVAFGCLWLPMFGRPSLAGWWFGHASHATLERERQAFRKENAG
ncbi:hypothetical protein RSSM_02926 [Rhodopirellula sallentina SM41]|uniref:Uncharacterized protein n=1 Tax=Rhodopirellula sallentina SM41 TaxID=1263870 RepID=M5UCQ1_9BACT|nr:hypothetical protein RSSM_02926 [Rhodopirellula sallentina SM41]